MGEDQNIKDSATKLIDELMAQFSDQIYVGLVLDVEANRMHYCRTGPEELQTKTWNVMLHPEQGDEYFKWLEEQQYPDRFTDEHAQRFIDLIISDLYLCIFVVFGGAHPKIYKSLPDTLVKDFLQLLDQKEGFFNEI